MTIRMCVFTASDIDHLSARFTIPQLRYEVRQAELRACVAETYQDTEYETTDDLFPWINYAEACCEAIRWRQCNQLKPQPASGRMDIESIKAGVDIEVVIERYLDLRKAGRTFVGLCPFHSDRHPSFTVYPDDGHWHCFGCGRHGDVIDFLMLIEGCDFRQAMEAL